VVLKLLGAYRWTGNFYLVVYTDALMVDVPEVSYQGAATTFTYEDRFLG